MKQKEDCKVAKEEWITEENKDDEFIFAQAVDKEGKGYLEQYVNPKFVKKTKTEPKEIKAKKEEPSPSEQGTTEKPTKKKKFFGGK